MICFAKIAQILQISKQTTTKQEQIHTTLLQGGGYQAHKKKKALQISDLQDIFAEREGFEPPVPLSTSVFKTGAIDHSAISPKVRPQGFEPWTH